MFLKIKIKIVGMSKARTFRLCIIALLLTHLTSYLSLAEQKDFDSYCNGRFGFCVDYPKHFTIGPEPVNRDGRRFYDPKGFLVIAAGHFNALDNTLEQEMQDAILDSFDMVNEQTTGANWFILSGHRGSNNIYVKTFVDKNVISTLHIRYPRQYASEYKETILMISSSFRQKKLNFPD
jgi:hypothetical protein